MASEDELLNSFMQEVARTAEAPAAVVATGSLQPGVQPTDVAAAAEVRQLAPAMMPGQNVVSPQQVSQNVDPMQQHDPWGGAAASLRPNAPVAPTVETAAPPSTPMVYVPTPASSAGPTQPTVQQPDYMWTLQQMQYQLQMMMLMQQGAGGTTSTDSECSSWTVDDA